MKILNGSWLPCWFRSALVKSILFNALFLLFFGCYLNFFSPARNRKTLVPWLISFWITVIYYDIWKVYRPYLCAKDVFNVKHLSLYDLIDSLYLFFFFLQTVPSCQNLYKNSFTYHCLKDDKTLQFDDAVEFLGLFFFHLQHWFCVLFWKCLILI